MGYSIAFAGKGGTGKTTMAGLLVQHLVSTGKTPVLAVDADANSNLNEVLGVNVDETLGDAREEMKTGVSTGMTKNIFMEMKLEESIVEAAGYDLIVMGRPEGPGCYCAANSLLTQCLENLIDNYSYIVLDNEAGMEHISRLTTNDVDVLVAVADPTRRGIQAASRIIELTDKLKLSIRKQMLLVNQVRQDQADAIERTVGEYNLELVGMVPDDPEVREFDLSGRPIVELDSANPALKAANEIFDKILEA